MKKLLLSIITASSITSIANAQQAEPIFVIDNKIEVFADEFWREYKQHSDTEPDDLKQLVERYANYRLQIYDAEQRRLDTAAAVMSARDYYQNYLISKHVAESKESQRIISQLARESGTQYRVSHIQVNIDGDQPSDTAAAYFKAAKIRTRLTSGADFALVARQLSDDPSANYNGGDLGYISMFEMPGFNFAKYVKANVGSSEISQPVCDAKAYHIIKVSDKRNAVDSVSVSCIEIRKTKKWRIDDSLRTLAVQLCEKLKNGENFSALQKKHSYQQGEQKLSVFEAVEKFGTQINDLKSEGSTYAKPVETYSSLLIVRLNKAYPRRTDSNMNEKIKSRFMLSKKFKELTDIFLDSIKTASGFTGVEGYGELAKALDETIFDGEWIPQEGLMLIDDKLFSFDKKTYSLGDFARYIYENQAPCALTSIPAYLDAKIKEMTDRLAFEAAKKMLLRRYPFYNVLLHEYTYPILYSLADRYNSAEQKADNYADVEEYYKHNASRYLSGYSLYLRIFEPVSGASPKKVIKSAAELAGTIDKSPDLSLLKPVAADTFELGQNATADIIIRGFDSGEYSYPADKVINLAAQNRIVVVKVLEEPHPVELNQIYSQVSAEYRSTLKAGYSNSLRNKYDLKISKNAETISWRS